jgi:serine/threonine-protein kinase
MTAKCPKCKSDNPATAKFCSECAAPLPSAGEISDSQTKTFLIPAKDLIKGTTFAGRYQIIEELGRGGMGVVYKAEDTKLKRTVALKFLPPELTHIPDVKERFMREAQAAAALDHPNICTVYEFDEAEEKTFISMAYVEGQSLREKIKSGPLELDEALRIAVQITEGLQKAHKNGVIHRDIKSANIMLTEEGQAKIMDFGLARMTGQTMQTKEGMVMGTIAYMSPEQARGEEVDHRTDIWSLGVVLYEILSGRQPFKGEQEQAVVYSILNKKPKPITDLRAEIPVSIGQIVNKALEKNPDKRYQQIDEQLDDLKSISAGIVPEEIKARLRKETLRKRKKAISYTVMVCLFMLIILRIFYFRKEPEKSIAVRPFNYISDEPDKQYLADGVMEAILLHLSKIEDLRVVSKTSVEQYRDTDKTVNTICQELDVVYLLEGSFQKYDDKTKLIVTLIKSGKERQVWSNEYDQNWEDIISVQSEVAQNVASELQVAITPEEKRLIEKIPTTNMAAYDAYLKGQFHLYSATPEDLDTAAHFYELAKDIDPEFAPAYAGIAGVWLWHQQLYLASPDEAGPKIMEALETALELDNTLAEAHQQLASMYVWGMYDWKAGEKAFKKAIAINPNYVEAHAFFSLLLNTLRRPEEAIEHIEFALKLDPYSPTVKALYCMNLLFVRRYDDCISICREVYEKNPTMFLTTEILYQALFLTGRYEEAFEFIKLNFSKMNLFKDFDHVFDQYEKLGFAGTMNLEADTLQAQSKSKFLPPGALIYLYLMAGNKERALDFLEQAYQMRDPNMPYISTQPLYDGLQNEPRFQELLRKMNLPVDERD